MHEAGNLFIIDGQQCILQRKYKRNIPILKIVLKRNYSKRLSRSLPDVNAIKREGEVLWETIWDELLNKLQN